MKQKEKICAVVVTYNRKKLLYECLQSLLSQSMKLDEIILIDNASTDGTKQMIEECFNHIDYVQLDENIGGAGGFYEGIKRAYDKGYDWIWIMDDDAEPKQDALEKMAKYFYLDNAMALANLKVDKSGEILFNHLGFLNFDKTQIVKSISSKDLINNFVEVDFSSFVGLLINRHIIDKIGFPIKDFFIHHDDVEYCYRIRQSEKIYLIPNSIIFHKEAAKKTIEKRFLWRKSKRIPIENYWITYYGARNYIYLKRKYSKKKLTFIIITLIRYIKKIIGIILFDDYKYKRIKLVIKEAYDGFSMNLGKNVTKSF